MRKHKCRKSFTIVLLFVFLFVFIVPQTAWAAPSPLAPATVTFTATGTSTATVSWSACSDVNVYYIDVSTSSTFDDTWSNGSVSSGTSKDITGLSSGTTYYAYVAAVGSDWSYTGQTRSNSMNTFSVAPPSPLAPATVSLNVTGATTATVSWSACSGVKVYYIDVSTSPTFDGTWSNGSVSSGTTSKDITGLSPGTTYYAYVAAANSAYEYSGQTRSNPITIYTVTYNGNGNTGGTVPTSQSGNVNTNITLQTNSGNLVKTGYTFSGWNTATDGSGSSYTEGANYIIPANDTILYAKWTLSQCTVSFNTNGGSAVAPITQDLNTTISAPVDPTKTGYTFAGWYMDAGLTTAATFPYTITSDTTLYAKWTANTYNVTYDGNGNTGGTVPSSQSGDYNSGITLQTNSGSLEKTGGTFTGWNTQADGSGASYAAGASFAIPASDTTLYAQWTVNSYFVSFDGNGSTCGTVPTAANYNYGATVTVSGAGSLQRTGYTFAGWNTQPNGLGTSYAPNDTLTIGTTPVTLYAQWTINSYSITYDGNGADSGTAPYDASSPYSYNSTVTVFDNSGSLTRTGYTFNGWNTSADGTGTGYMAGSTFNMPGHDVTLYAQWTINSYSVSYDGNGYTGGSVPSAANYNYNVTVTASVYGSLERTGYTFSGWNTKADGTGTPYSPGDTFVIGTANVTLYAVWAINQYNVTYDGNGSDGGTTPAGASFNYNSNVSVSDCTYSKSGYSFIEWNTAPDGSGTTYSPSAVFTIPANDVTLYAIWDINDYTVTYDGNGNTAGAAPADGIFPYNTNATVSSHGSLVKTGYAFAGWNTKADGSGTSYVEGAIFALGSSDVTLYAQWTINSYSVTYDSNGADSGTVPASPSSHDYSTGVTVLGNTGTLTRTGYTFGGWNTAPDGTGSGYDEGGTFNMPGNAVTLYAVWNVNIYSVSYDGNGYTDGTVPSASSHDYGTTVTASGAGSLVRTGYSFAGWNTQADGLGTAIGSMFMLGAANVTLYAQWTIDNYSVTYNANGAGGGTAPADPSSPYNYNSPVTALGNTGTLTRAGYTFGGWNTASDGTGSGYVQGSTFNMPGNIVTLYAVWNLNTYSVSYNGNGNTGGTVPSSQSDSYNSSITLQTNSGNLIKTGYTFTGWNTAADGSGDSYAAEASFIIPANNTVLYAMWTVNTYNITYNGNGNTGGSVPSGQFGGYNSSITLQTNSGNLTKTGYTFAGWNTAADGSGTDYAAGASFTMPVNDTILYAVWTANTYNITYDGNGNTGGAAPSGQSGSYNSSITLQTNSGNLEKTGYTFAGWNTQTNGNGTSYTAGASYTIPASDTTLYAKWTVNQYTVSFDTDGGSAVAPITQDCNTTIAVPTDPSKTGYTFAGWYTDAGLTSTAAFPYTITANATLYAKWTVNTYTVTYNSNGNTGGTAPSSQPGSYNSSITLQTNSGNLTKTGYTFAGWNTAVDGSGTSYAAGASFTIPANDITLYAKWTVDGGGGGISNSGNSTNPSYDNTDVLLNGETKGHAGTSTTVTGADGQTTTTVTLDENKISEVLDTLPDNGGSTGNPSVLSIPVGNDADVVVGELTGQMVKYMAEKNVVIEIKTDLATYTIPAEQVKIDEVSTKLGTQVGLKDITVHIEISKPSVETAKVVENSAKLDEFSIVAPPVEFTVKCTYGDKTVEVSQFNSYVERTIAIPDGVDPAKVTTSVVVDSDGTVRHVPTLIISVDGKYYAKINSLSNSTYTVIYNPVEFKDVENHWAKDAVNDMGSRLVISGIGNNMFEPDRDITRAEFAAIIVRALGLKPGTGSNPFTDVSNTAWYCDYIKTAVEYKIISGYGDGKFGPNDKITREQAMTMVARAMNITGLKVQFANGEMDKLLASFGDAAKSADYAKNSIAACVETGIITGRNGNLVAPKDNITRAEVAVIVRRLLQKSGLI